jgi:hypothetical protein
LHLHGTKDVNYPRGKEQLKKFYDPNSVMVLDIEYDHAMPWKRGDVDSFVGCIRKLAISAAAQEKAARLNS